MGRGLDFHLTFPSPSFFDHERLLKTVRQRSIPNHFILKVIWRKWPNPAHPRLFWNLARGQCLEARHHWRPGIGERRNRRKMVGVRNCPESGGEASRTPGIDDNVALPEILGAFIDADH